MFGWNLFRRPAQIQNVQEKNNLSYTMNLGWKQDVGGVNQDISRVEGCVRQIILFLNILNLGWPSEQVPAKQTLFPPLAHIPLPWKNLS